MRLTNNHSNFHFNWFPQLIMTFKKKQRVSQHHYEFYKTNVSVRQLFRKRAAAEKQCPHGRNNILQKIQTVTTSIALFIVSYKFRFHSNVVINRMNCFEYANQADTSRKHDGLPFSCNIWNYCYLSVFLQTTKTKNLFF